MTDITIRLRSRKEQEIMEDGYVRVEWEDEDAMEAADEIERLREALREIGEKLTPEKYEYENCLETYCGELARAALEGKE
jgi:hypothetical protein